MLPKNDCLRKIFVVFSFFETFCTRVGHSERFGQGFVHSEDNVRYFGDDVPGVSQSFSEDQTFSYQDEAGTITVLGSPIKFDPPNLNFKEQPIGVPLLRKVTIHNINGHSSIQMLSISGNTIHFHCSFFNDKVIPPGGNTTFDVVFLGRETGMVENTLYIHTSAGSFRYNVEGVGTPNPYRIQPLVGVKLPLNSSYSPVIQMHNPHGATIQVLEMYSSGGDLHLELPEGGEEGDTALWQIPPYQTKPVMRATFLARAESNHTAYIRIKTNTTGAEFLYLPLEVEVSSQPGLYCPQEILNFGLVPSDSGPQTMELLLLNSGSRPVTLNSLVATPVTEALSVDFSAVKISPDTLHPLPVSTLTFDPSLASADGVQSGKLLLKSSNSKYKVSVPWTATVLKGGLHWNTTAARFLLTDKPDPEDPSHQHVISRSRPLKITNQFAVPVVIHSVSMPEAAHNFFELGPFRATVIPPGHTVDLVQITVRPEAWAGTRQLESFLTLATNLTQAGVSVPLTAFHGRLQPYLPSSPSESVLDFGTIGMEEKRDLYFALINKGPVKVVLRGWGGNITGSLIELMGMAPGNESQLAGRQNFSDLSRRLYVLPGHYIVFRIGLQSGAEEGEFHASVFVSSEYEELRVPFRFRVAKGSLSTHPQQLAFDTAFPGKVSELKLHVHSSFKHKMRVKDLSVVGDDPRFTFSISQASGGSIPPGQKSFVGRVTFDPGAVCSLTEDCYTGFLPEGKFGHPWYLGLALPLNLGDMDLAVVHSLWARMRAAAHPNSMFNVTLRLDTTEVRGFLFTARAALSWPLLTSQSILSFPLTQLGNSSRQELIVSNPSSRTLLVHLVPQSAYPNAQNVLNLLPNRIKLPASDDGTTQSEDPSLFQIESVTDANDPLAALDTFGEGFAEKFGVEISPVTHPILLRPGQSARVTVVFTPTEPPGPRVSVLFVRNNLTGVDVVDLHGSGANGDIKFGNRRAGSVIHAFEVTEKHLKDCDKTASNSKGHGLPNLTVKRPFTARNTGEVPLWVTGFDVDGKPCEGFGFKVLDCEPFLLAANDSKKINIAFTPDFTLSRVTRTLTLRTSLGDKPGQGNVKYSLAASVPSHLLAVCSRALPRPSWEILLYYGIISLLTFSLCCVMIAAFVEADRILKYCFFLAQQNIVPENAKILDLKEVARSVLAEQDKRLALSRDPRLNSGSGLDLLRQDNPLACLPETPDLTPNTHQDPARGDLSVVSCFGSYLRFLLQFLNPVPNAIDPTTQEDPSPQVPDLNPPAKKSLQEYKKKPEPIKSSPVVTLRKPKVKKLSKPKLSSQNSVNDEMETSSTTTESSNPEELMEPFNKGLAVVSSTRSESPTVLLPEQSKKKKKTKTKAVETEPVKESKPKAKKSLERTESKPDRVEKARLSPKSSLEPLVKPQQQTPPVLVKQEAKVKGVPKEDPSVLRRQQSAPAYSPPPRLQNHSASLSPRPEDGAGRGSPCHPPESFPDRMLSSSRPSQDRPDPPRAIILPEMKQNAKSPYGPIGCKVPRDPREPHLISKSMWQESPAAPAPLVAHPDSARGLALAPIRQQSGPASLLPPPGLTIMQQLQAERRQREEEYARRQNNWPGFENCVSIQHPLVGSGGREMGRDYVESLWDQPGGHSQGQTGLWGTIGNVWPSSVFNNPGFHYQGEAANGAETGSKEEGEAGLSFNSLSLSSIWASAGNQQQEGENSSWSSLFNNNTKKDI